MVLKCETQRLNMKVTRQEKEGELLRKVLWNIVSYTASGADWILPCLTTVFSKFYLFNQDKGFKSKKGGVSLSALGSYMTK